MSKKKGKEEQTLDEKLKMAIVPKEEEPYKVPDNWVWTRLGEISKFKNGYAFKSTEFVNEGIPLIRMGNLYKNKLDLSRNPAFVPYDIDKEIVEKYSVKNEDILLTLTGTKYKRDYGYAILVENLEETVLLNQRILSINFNEEIKKYGYFYLKSNTFRDKFFSFETGGVNQGNVSSNAVASIYFPLPPIDEQKRIVNKLDYFFDKIQKVKEIIEEVKEKNEARKESILSKAFTGELTAKWRADNIHSAKELLNKINDEKLSNWEQECQKAEAEGRKKPTKPKLKSIDEMIVPNDEIPYKIPNNWVWTRLEDIASYIQRGKSPKYVDESSIYVISQKCVQWTGFELDKARYTSDEVKYTEERFLKKGDILWNSTGTGTVGRVCTLEEIDENQKMVADSHVTVVRTSDNVISKCILNYLISNNVQNNLDSLTTGSTNQKELTLSSVKNLAIPLPPIEEQKEIVRILDNIFTKENLINELISLEDKIQALEKSILSKAFRGELGTNSKDDIEAMELLKEILQK